MERNKKPYYITVSDEYVRHKARVDEDHEPCVGWWLEYSEHKRSCPCWVFHVAIDKNETHSKGYEYILIPHRGEIDKVVERLMCESINCHIMTYRAVEIVKSSGINKEG